MNSLNGKVAIITGAAAGIGFATARIMAERGAQVVMTGTRAAAIEAAAEKIRAAGGQAQALRMDLSEPASIEALINGVIQQHGRIDILFNNAADLSVTSRDMDIEHMDLEVWDRIFTVNVRGTMLCCKHALPHMVKQGGGVIINTASVLGMHAAPVQAGYAASKAAVIQLSRSIATSHGKRGIRCNAILPGLIVTEGAQANLPPFIFEITESENLTPYLGKPEDIGYTVAFLASDEARYITGQAIVADGGANAHISGFGQMGKLPPPPAG